jgi:hypothetical protein
MKGRIGMTRSGMGSDTRMRIEIEDAKSGVSFLEITMDMEKWAYAATGMFGVEMDFELRGVDTIGKVHETKTELVPVPENMPYKADDNLELIEDILSEFEVDGWQAHTNDLFNHHRRIRDGENIYQEVSFHRYVEDTDNA